MIVTEDEAKTKQCQEGITRQPAPTASFAFVVPHCIGSACMAWRWGEYESEGEYGSPRGAGTRGYCGKAGRP